MRKAVLITGASGGLGDALVRTFDDSMYFLILHCNKNQITKYPQTDYLDYKGDLRHEKTVFDISRMVKLLDVDIIINNAGVYENKDIVEMTPDRIQEMVSINLIAPMLLIQNGIKFFEERKRGTIININSLAGKSGSHGESVYCASKHGLRGFSRSIQQEVYYTRILDVYLGAMKTNMTNNRADKELLIDPREVAETIKSMCEIDLHTSRITEIEIKRARY